MSESYCALHGTRDLCAWADRRNASEERNKKQKKPSKKSQLEDSFSAELAMFGIPTPVRQYRFHAVRLWRFDFAWPDRRIAVEIHGGIFMAAGKGGHNRGAYMEKSFEKSNVAQLGGWKVLIFGPSQIRGSKRLTRASPACEFLFKIFNPGPGVDDAR